jgi:cytochrome c-type biogenesis protein CcmH/NrfF
MNEYLWLIPILLLTVGLVVLVVLVYKSTRKKQFKD